MAGEPTTSRSAPGLAWISASDYGGSTSRAVTLTDGASVVASASCTNRLTSPLRPVGALALAPRGLGPGVEGTRRERIWGLEAFGYAMPPPIKVCSYG